MPSVSAVFWPNIARTSAAFKEPHMSATTVSPVLRTGEVSLFRLYVLRALYLLIVVGLGTGIWPSVFDPQRGWGLIPGQFYCMLASFSLLCLLGLRYPLQMIPVLLWELVWKTLWLGIVPLPQWLAGHVDESMKPTIFAISLVVLIYIALPWRYVFAHYVKARGDRWW
jgi:hypothetical protein